MIIETLFNAIKAVFLGVMDLLPKMDSFQAPTGFFTWFTEIMSASAYFLPLADFLIMFGIWFTVVNFELIWKIIQRLYDSIPFV